MMEAYVRLPNQQVNKMVCTVKQEWVPYIHRKVGTLQATSKPNKPII
jgi:hypothetical protein